MQEAEGDPHRRRLPGTVGAQEAEDFARADLEVDAIERLDLTESFAKPLDPEHVLPSVRQAETNAPPTPRHGYTAMPGSLS
jgi:hypothetical protein